MANGRGKPGFCKICIHPAAQFLNKRYEAEGEDFNAAKAARLAKEIDSDFSFSRQTWYSHLEHITHPLVTAVEDAKKHPVVVPKTNEGVLEAIRDIGMRRAAEHPDEVGVDHALKAASILAQKQPKSDSIVVLLAKVISASPPPEIIEGEFTEVTPVLTTEEEPK